MDTLRGAFESSDHSDVSADYDLTDEGNAGDEPPASIGRDERRMQVRAYNHWAGLLGDQNYPSIEDLDPTNLPDFGPYSVLLDFSTGIEDPAVRYVGDMLAKECGTDDEINRLSDVPARSLLSRITDHYMQILANQAPIGFEAEFVNQRGITILYRGILLPYSSDDDTIDFIYGVINWKEMASAAVADELLLEIDQALEAETAAQAEEDPAPRAADPVTDWADGPGFDDEDALELSVESALSPADGDEGYENGITPLELGAEDEVDYAADLPEPAFGDYALDDDYEEDEEGEDEDEANYDFASLTDHIRAPAKKSEAIDLGGFEAYAADDDADIYGESVYGDEAYAEDSDAQGNVHAEDAPQPEVSFSGAAFGRNGSGVAAVPQEYVPQTGSTDHVEVEPVSFDEDEAFDLVEEQVEDAEAFELDASFEVEQAAPVAEPAVEVIESATPVAASVPVADEGESSLVETEELPGDAGLYDYLASARELAQTARASEDRSRHALYAAVGRAYDFSIAAQESPEEYDELVEESGLSVQERAPMTPVVKLVFGAEYDKTRLTEYAAVLSHAHRVGIERGKLASYLSKADGGLKGVVTAERRFRKEEAGKPVEPEGQPRAALVKKLRKLDHFTFDDISTEGPEFTLVLIRRTEEGEVAVLGEIDDVQLVEKVGRKLIG